MQSWATSCNSLVLLFNALYNTANIFSLFVDIYEQAASAPVNEIYIYMYCEVPLITPLMVCTCQKLSL